MLEENNLNWFHVIVGAIITFIVAMSLVVEAQAIPAHPLALLLSQAQAIPAHPLAALLATRTVHAKTCSKMCDPARSQPCGNSCISKFNKCRKSWTTACVGTREENEVDGQSFFSNPTHKEPDVQK